MEMHSEYLDASVPQSAVKFPAPLLEDGSAVSKNRIDAASKANKT
jgi:hypothetical protein